MEEFILEEQIENIINKNTKEYIKEVVSSYNNRNYRAAVVVLYTIVIYDLLEKMVTLKEIYNDKGATEILNKVKACQSDNPKNPEWEGKLIEDIYNETKLITAVEKEELIHIKNERNYAAHPIINIDVDNEYLQLKSITKETARDLIRKAFEIVFLRDTILAKKIVKDVVDDLNNYYDRVGNDGLETFLNKRYFRLMTQERKNDLFKSLWKFVFILEDADCNKNRESNYYGLVLLYNENKDYYMELVKKCEDFYLNKLELETIKSWSVKDNIIIELSTIFTFKRNSRIIFFISFIKKFPSLYKILNDHSKNILIQSINHMYTDYDVVESDYYECMNSKKELLEEQVKLKSTTLFLSEDISLHFKMIHKMISNYTYTARNYTIVENYCILDDNDLDVIFLQSWDRGCESEFITFLIDYCTGAKTYYQARSLFNSLTMYKKYFTEEHFYKIMAGMNNNHEYYGNKYKQEFIHKIERMFIDTFDTELIKSDEERYLYKNLYSFNKNITNVVKILDLIEKRAMHYSIYSLYNIICDLLDSVENIDDLLANQHPLSYPNIMRVLNNNNNPNFKKCYWENFTNYFKIS